MSEAVLSWANPSGEVEDAGRSNNAAQLISLRFPAACHFEPVQLLLYLMKGIVADFVVYTHRENYFPSRPDGFTVDVGCVECM